MPPPLSSAVRRLYGSLPPPNLSALSRSFYRVTSCGLIKEPLVTPVHFYSAAQHFGLRVCIGSGQSGIPQSDRGRAMQDAVSELPRIRLPRTPLNRGIKKAKGFHMQALGFETIPLRLLSRRCVTRGIGGRLLLQPAAFTRWLLSWRSLPALRLARGGRNLGERHAT